MTGNKGRRRRVVQRTCVACREKMEKRRLTRLVRMQDGEAVRILLDPTGKMPGRGAYVCDNSACRRRVVETQVLAQALRTEISAQHRASLRERLLPDTAGAPEA